MARKRPLVSTKLGSVLTMALMASAYGAGPKNE
jgi:hypothetical protein